MNKKKLIRIKAHLADMTSSERTDEKGVRILRENCRSLIDRVEDLQDLLKKISAKASAGDKMVYLAPRILSEIHLLIEENTDV